MSGVFLIFECMKVIGKRIQEAAGYVIGLSTIALIIFNGFGLRGEYIVGYFLLLLVLVIWSCAVNKSQFTYKLPSIIYFNVKVSVLVGLVIWWVSLADYFLVELFKVTFIPLEDTAYWNVFFGMLIPVFIIFSCALFYFGTHNISYTWRILLLTGFGLASNANDLLYYRIFNIDFPENWSWVVQPRFLFGGEIVTIEVVYWIIICVLMGFVLSCLPLEAVFKEQRSIDKSRPRIAFELVIIGSLIFATIIGGSRAIPLVEENLSDIKKDVISNSLYEGLNTDLVGNETWEAHTLITDLNYYYLDKGSYPLSTGNCTEEWDSSINGFGFTTTLPIQDLPYDNENCTIDENSSVIMYYSDGQRFVIVLGADSSPLSHPNLYNPGTNDVEWFESGDYFGATWDWNTPMLVYMYEQGREVTNFEPANE